MADMGFLAGGSGATDTYSTQAHLNARPAQTHVVDDGVTQVVRGGVECELDGGTVQVALYDITGGVDGTAELLFVHEETLPERPAATGDGYEVATHVFPVDPFSLHDRVGRRLAVAVKHDAIRKWGHDWNDPSDAGIYTAHGDGFPSDPWQGSLEDGYSPRSGALFVEPKTVPDGKARTVVGDAHGDLSRTVFAAFPTISPVTGMVVEYDAQTAAGAAVTVLPSGVVEVGPGSAATDSFTVRLRAAAGEWHGPKTITLTDRR